MLAPSLWRWRYVSQLTHIVKRQLTTLRLGQSINYRLPTGCTCFIAETAAAGSNITAAPFRDRIAIAPDTSSRTPCFARALRALKPSKWLFPDV